MRTYGVGILGSGVISRTYIADIQKFYKALDIRAVADIDRRLARTLADEFGIPKAYVTGELLQDPDIEIVINLTPPQFHVELDKQILGAGKHLFSEKPFAPTLAEAAQVLAYAREKGCMVGGAPDTFLGAGIQTCRRLVSGRGDHRNPLLCHRQYDHLRCRNLAPQSRCLLSAGSGSHHGYGALLSVRNCGAAGAY